MKAKTENTKLSSSRTMSRIILMCGLAISFVLTAVLTTLSFDLGLMATGFLGLSFLMLYDREKRFDQDSDTSGDIATLKKEVTSLTKKTQTNERKIENLRDFVSRELDRLSLKINQKNVPDTSKVKQTIKKTTPAPISRTENAIKKPAVFGRKPIETKSKTPASKMKSVSSTPKKAVNQFKTPQKFKDLGKNVRAASPLQKHAEQKERKTYKEKITNQYVPEPKDFMNTKVTNHAMTDYFDSLSDMVVRELLHHCIRNEDITVFMQPVVNLPQRHIKYYELSARLRARPGLYIPASRYHELAKTEKMQADIDRLVLQQAIDMVTMVTGSYISNTHRSKNVGFFINVAPQTLVNKSFIGTLLGFLGKNKALAEHFVLEMDAEAFLNAPVATHKVMQALSKIGCRFSLDHVKNTALNMSQMKMLNIRFVKMDAEILLKTNQKRSAAPKRGSIIAPENLPFLRFMQKLEGIGSSMVVSKIENETALKNLLDYGIHYGQGFMFGKPDVQSVYGMDVLSENKNKASARPLTNPPKRDISGTFTQKSRAI